MAKKSDYKREKITVGTMSKLLGVKELWKLPNIRVVLVKGADAKYLMIVDESDWEQWKKDGNFELAHYSELIF
jgi:hypothetical protein